MYLCKTITKESSIEGNGVFTAESIMKGSIVWKFDSSHDQALSEEEFSKLDEAGKREIEKVGYLSPTSKVWIYPSKDDLARFTNHSSINNNLSVSFDAAISPEPFFVANRNILPGEELIVNYLEFDEFIKNTKPGWV